MNPDWCGDCNSPVVEKDPGTVIVAQFDSECHECGGDILAGDRTLVRDEMYLCSDHIVEPDGDPDPFAW
jgi:hypothetical protein